MTTHCNDLFSPGCIGTVVIPNRLAMPPMGTNYATWTGEVTDRLIGYYAERARGGVGLITVEFSYVHPTGRISFYALGVHDDALVPGLRALTDAIHANGAKVSIQIAHGGRRCRSGITGMQPMGPSAIPCLGGEVPRSLSPAEIDTMVSWFVQAARRVQEAGFDAVTLHMAAGYLLQSFLSPYANQRDDQYGGSLEGRMRLPLEVLRNVRRQVGESLSILARLCVDEFVEGGLTLSEARQIAQLLEQAGLDAIDTAAGIPEMMHFSQPPMALSRGFLVSHARAIKEVVRIPVFAVGRINDPLLAERILQEGSADFVSMGRPLLADPNLPNKAREGRFDEIRPCIGCNEGCFKRLYAQLDVSCTANPRAGRESLFPEGPASQLKKVLVVGGGPAGMTAAIVAAGRGHRVTLCEQEAQLGGQLRMGDVPPHREEMRTLLEYLTGQLSKSVVEVQLCTTVTADTAREVGADVVILATGARPLKPRIPFEDGSVLSSWDVLTGKAVPGSRVVVVGGGEVGCELAELLATQGREVVIVEMLQDIAIQMEPRGRTLLMGRLRQLGVKVLTQSSVNHVAGATVHYEQGGLKYQIRDVDDVVWAVGSASNDSLRGPLMAAGIEPRCIGDCVKPRRILEAIREGYELAQSL